jgi:hypothetical protein
MHIHIRHVRRHHYRKLAARLRRTTWLVIATIAFWSIVLVGWMLLPSGTPAAERKTTVVAAQNSQAAWVVMTATMSMAGTVLLWMLTLPPNNRPPRK